MENHSLTSVLFESNIINFVIFLGVAVWFLGKSFPGLVQQKNEELEAELRKANERCRLAEEQLQIAEKELSAFKANLATMKSQSELRIRSLQDELNSERERNLELLKVKCEKDINHHRISLRQELQSKIVSEAFQLVENKLRQSSLDEITQVSINETLQLIQSNPQLLKN